MSVTYPTDTSGMSPGNLVTGDIYSVSETRYRDYQILVPRFAPFFVDNFKVTINTSGGVRELQEDVEFSFTLPYLTGTRTVGKPLYGGITLHNLDVNGIITLEYQTLGGDHIVDRLYVLNYLVEHVYNPRTTVWDVITNAPEAFAPTPHFQDYDTMYGQEQVIGKLSDIADAIATNSSLTVDAFNEFIALIGGAGSTAFLSISGGKMEGVLELFRDPQLDMEPVNFRFLRQNYLTKEDFQVSTLNFLTQAQMTDALNGKLDKSGGEMTGFLVLNSEPTRDMHAVPRTYVDTKVNSINSSIGDLEDDLATVKQEYVTKEQLDKTVGVLLAHIYAREGK